MMSKKKGHHASRAYFEDFTFTLFALKSNFNLPKPVCQLLLLFIYTQPISLNEIKNQFSLIDIILRPINAVLTKYSTNQEYWFLLPLIYSVLQKFILFSFLYQMIKKNKNTFEGSISSFKNSLIWNAVCSLLNLFLNLNGSFMFVELLILCLKSLKQNVNSNVNYQLLIFNIFTIILIVLDCIQSLVIYETQITHKAQGIEKLKNTMLRYIYQLIMVVQIILTVYFEGEGINYFIHVFGLIQQLIIIVDIFSYSAFALNYQKTAISLSVAINIAFYSVSLISTIEQAEFKTIFLVIFTLITAILLSQNKKKEMRMLLTLFQKKNINEYDLLIAVIRLINNDFDYTDEFILLSILIGRWHSLKCTDNYCCYCNQMSIQQTEQSCAITTQIFSEFIQWQIEKILPQFNQNSLKTEKSKYSLYYTYFLYDRGHVLKSLKFLNQLLVTHTTNNNVNFKDNILKQEEVHLLKSMNTNNFYESLSWIEKLKIKYIIQKGKSQIIQKFYQSSLLADQQSMIQEFIKNYLKSEREIHQYEAKLLHIIQQKRLFFINLLSSRDINNKEKFFSNNEDWFKLCSFIQQLHKLLKKSIQIQTQNSLRFVSIYSYFLGEILSDYYKATHYYKTSKLRQLELLKFQQIKNFDLNQKVEYIIMGLCEDFANLQTLSHSTQFFQQYGYKGNQNEFSQLIPEFLQKVHFHHVSQFLLNGKDKYYNVFQINLIATPSNLLTTVNMCHTINSQSSKNTLSFAVFIQDAHIDYTFLLIDDSSKRCYFTKNLLALIGWNESEISQLCEKNYLQNLKISFIYPEFENQMMINSNLDEFKVCKAKLYFPHPGNNQVEIKNLQKPNPFLQSEIITLECDVFIIKKQIANQKFYQIEIQNITKKLQDMQINSETSLNKNIAVEHEFNLKDNESDCNSQIQYHKESHLTIVNASKKKFSSIFFNLEQERPNIDGEKGTYTFPELYSNLNSRRDQTIMQYEAQITQKMIMQQSESQIVNSDKKQINEDRNEVKQKTTTDQSTKNDTMKDRMKQHHDLISSILSLNAVKFELKLIFILSFWFALFLIFAVFQYDTFSKDLEQCFSSIQITSFYSGIMSPHDLFFSMRVTITGYQQMNREGFISNDQLPPLIEAFQDQLELGFEELRENFYSQLKNEILGLFINEVNVTLYFMKENQTEIYPVETSFRDALFAILQYQYAQMMTLHYRKSTSNQPFQIFLFANYFQNHNKFEVLANEMYDYALNFHSKLLLKWCWIWLCFTLGLALCYGYLQYFQFAYFKQLDGFYKVIQYLTNTEIEREVKKLSTNQILLAQNINSIQKYNPENKIRECELQHSRSQISSNKYYKISESVSYFKNSSIRLKNVALFLLLLLMLFIFVFFSIAQIINFFIKSKNTTQFYQEMLNMQLRSGNLYLYREIFFRWSNFTFLTENDKDSLYQLVDKAQQSIDNYVYIANGVDFSALLAQENFIELFDEINTQSFCFMIDERFVNLYSKYCNLSFNGAINEGMIYALKYVSNQIKTQQAMNNFTKRVEFELYEQEGAQIISRVFFILNSQLMINIRQLYDQIQNAFKVLTIVYSVLLVIIYYLMLAYYAPYLGRILKTIKRGVHLIPLESMLQNESLERKLKELQFKFY